MSHGNTLGVKILRVFRLSSAIVAILALAVAGKTRADDMAIKNQEARSFSTKLSRKVQLEYLIYFPPGYDRDKDKKWPLILFLHGAGERGANISKVAIHGPPKMVKTKPDLPFVIVSPQCPSSQTWDNEALLSLLDEIIEKNQIDERRIYLTGLSMGGYGTWSLGLEHPDRFAAIAPICGGGNRLPILLPRAGQQSALKKLPVWAFHGEKDEVVPLLESERMVNALRSIGNDAKFTIYPGAGHDSWAQTYDQQELYSWFLQHQAPAKKKAGKKGR